MSNTQYTLAASAITLLLALASCDRPHPNESTTAADLSAQRISSHDEPRFTSDFRLQDCDFKTVGRNPYLLLVPGRVHVLEGNVDGVLERLELSVLDETLAIDGTETRVVEERHTEDGQLVEVSRNYFAFCSQNASIFYFGEDVDFYENGQVVGHDGTWRHGVNGARAGVFMPGIALLGSRYFQEIAPRVALDRAEIIELDGTVRTPFGRFRELLVTEESTPLEPGVLEFKMYAPGFGLVVDAELKLVAVQGG